MTPAEAGRSRSWGALSLVVALLLAILLPFVFAQIMFVSLAKLHLTPQGALVAVVAMLVGGMVNIPIRRIVREEVVVDDPLAVFGLAGLWPGLRRETRQTTLAINVGGCIVPSGLAAYECVQLLSLGSGMIAATAIAVSANIAICFVLARPVPGLGIAMPIGVPAVAAAICALALAPEQAAPVAFVAGTMGPLVGADLFHLGAVSKTSVGVASIGGAGTFDGIVLSGLIAAYLT
jgi:uncharacterized membrane protein